MVILRQINKLYFSQTLTASKLEAVFLCSDKTLCLQKNPKKHLFRISNQRSQWWRFHDFANVIILRRYAKDGTGQSIKKRFAEASASTKSRRGKSSRLFPTILNPPRQASRRAADASSCVPRAEFRSAAITTDFKKCQVQESAFLPIPKRYRALIAAGQLPVSARARSGSAWLRPCARSAFFRRASTTPKFLARCGNSSGRRSIPPSAIRTRRWYRRTSSYRR